ncbi:MAG: tRNA threonylcarbamoyladenosine dehydratase [Muribaculaceae bacterium]|nr:tRNA threonylcarbamoyladenosine dehydratase [Muribaculaceae bacterium]
MDSEKIRETTVQLRTDVLTERWDERTERLLGADAMRRLAESRVLVVGVGGVGGYAAEMLARSGVGHLTLVDSDEVSVTNLNRQLIALGSTVGRSKTELFARRFADINPAISVKGLRLYLTPDNVAELLTEHYDYVVDCIDTVAPKVSLILSSLERGYPIISSMGAGGRTDVTKVGYFSLWDTREDGLARAVRQRLKSLGRKPSLKVVASSEAPSSSSLIDVSERNKRTSYGTLATVPSLFGIYLANYVIKKLISN